MTRNLLVGVTDERGRIEWLVESHASTDKGALAAILRRLKRDYPDALGWDAAIHTGNVAPTAEQKLNVKAEPCDINPGPSSAPGVWQTLTLPLFGSRIIGRETQWVSEYPKGTGGYLWGVSGFEYRVPLPVRIAQQFLADHRGDRSAIISDSASRVIRSDGELEGDWRAAP